MGEFVKQENDFIVFHGNLQHLMEKVETGKMIPKLQASHSPMCKFFTPITSSAGYFMWFPWSTVRPDIHYTCQDFVGTRECCEIREFH